MTDPLDALRLEIPSIEPDPAFAAGLRERLRRALSEPGGVVMSTETRSQEDIAWGPTIQPYLGVHDARRALDWYVEVFEATRRGEPVLLPDGHIGHAELRIGDAVLMLAEYGPGPAQAGEPRTGPAHSLFVSVPDVDETVRRAVAGGAEMERPPSDEPYGRTGVVVDPFGHRWMVNTRPRSASQARPGDITYVTLSVRDEGRARQFYGAVLGSRILEGETSPAVAIYDGPMEGGQGLGTVPVYRVEDVDAAVARVRAGGGRAFDPEDQPYGRIASAVDPEGNHFSVWEPPRDPSIAAGGSDELPAGES